MSLKENAKMKYASLIIFPAWYQSEVSIVGS